MTLGLVSKSNANPLFKYFEKDGYQRKSSSQIVALLKNLAPGCEAYQMKILAESYLRFGNKDGNLEAAIRNFVCEKTPKYSYDKIRAVEFRVFQVFSRVIQNSQLPVEISFQQNLGIIDPEDVEIGAQQGSVLFFRKGTFN